ncbi:MAG TPA: C4-type zinc ribbon domain-containing protein [Desulfomonilaceae bacterium]|nr:C4-type zinc ribbon domain-containing protein [Desulfomonilaceae bacterium]
MKEQLQLLEKLQEVDTQIDQHEHDLARLPLEVRDIARSLVVLRREITENKERMESVEKDLRKREQDLAVEQEKIKRSERRLLSIKNQKEYNALSREVKLGKKVVGEIEDAILGFMTEIESLKKGLEKRETDYQGLESGLLDKKAEAEAVTVQSKEALALLNSEKKKITESIEREFLRKYQTVKKARGNAIVQLENGTCTGCHMAIPPQLNIRVLKQEEMIICPNCNRILYVKPENIPVYNKLDS